MHVWGHLGRPPPFVHEFGVIIWGVTPPLGHFFLYGGVPPAVRRPDGPRNPGPGPGPISACEKGMQPGQALEALDRMLRAQGPGPSVSPQGSVGTKGRGPGLRRGTRDSGPGAGPRATALGPGPRASGPEPQDSGPGPQVRAPGSGPRAQARTPGPGPGPRAPGRAGRAARAGRGPIFIPQLGSARTYRGSHFFCAGARWPAALPPRFLEGPACFLAHRGSLEGPVP